MLNDIITIMAIIIFLSVFTWSYQALYTYWKKELKDKKNKRATSYFFDIIQLLTHLVHYHQPSIPSIYRRILLIKSCLG